MVSREKIVDRQVGFKKQRSKADAMSKKTTKIIDGFRKKKKTAVIFFYIEKAYNKIIKNKPLKQLEKQKYGDE